MRVIAISSAWQCTPKIDRKSIENRHLIQAKSISLARQVAWPDAEALRAACSLKPRARQSPASVPPLRNSLPRPPHPLRPAPSPPCFEGVVTTLAGSGTNSCVDGTGTAASFAGPATLAVSGSTIYVSCKNHPETKPSGNPSETPPESHGNPVGTRR